MDKKTVAQELDKAFGETSIKIIAPRFLGFVENVLSEQFEKLVELVDKRQTLDVSELRKEFQDSRNLLMELKATIEANKIESLKVTNFPEQKVQVFPTKMDFKMPDWLEKMVLEKIQSYIKAGFDQARFNQTLLSKGFSMNQDSTVVPAVAGKRINIYAAKLVTTTDGSVNWKDGGVDLEGSQDYVANGGYTESINPPLFLFQTSPGNDLVLAANLIGNGRAAGRVSYWVE